MARTQILDTGGGPEQGQTDLTRSLVPSVAAYRKKYYPTIDDIIVTHKCVIHIFINQLSVFSRAIKRS